MRKALEELKNNRHSRNIYCLDPDKHDFETDMVFMLSDEKNGIYICPICLTELLGREITNEK